MNGSSREHEAPWSRFLIIVSAVASLILLAVGGLTLWAVRDLGGFGIALSVLVLALLPGSALFVIRGYRLDGAQLYVRRLLWETPVDLRGLDLVRFDPASLKGSIRLFGNGGLFSFSGVFWNRHLGRYRAFVTDHAKAVVLRISGRTVVVSPADPLGFVAEVLERNPRLRTNGAQQQEETSR